MPAVLIDIIDIQSLNKRELDEQLVLQTPVELRAGTLCYFEPRFPNNSGLELI